MGLDTDLKREWLETDGLGGFASCTVAGVHTRRYHGLLTVPTKRLVERMLLLSKFEETLYINGWRYDFSANQYPGIIHPNGYQYLRGFEQTPYPIYHYEFDGFRLEKRIFLVHGQSTVVVEYELHAPAQDCLLDIRPLVAFRDSHGVTHANSSLNPDVDTAPGIAAISPYKGTPTLFFAHNAESLERTGDWYYNFEYSVERERGFDFQEDLFTPFRLRFDLARNRTATVIASLSPHDVGEARGLREAETARRDVLRDSAPSRKPIVQELTAAADQYIVQAEDRKTIVAGYHWLGESDRDAMIALPGLTVVTGRHAVAREILAAFAAGGQRAVDSALWFVEAVRSYLRYSGDEAFIREQLYPHMIRIIDSLIGNAAGDALLACGEAGKPVAIQALWYNALRIAEDVAKQLGEIGRAEECRAMAASVSASFNVKFWNADAGCLYDAVDETDRSIRANQILAVSLPHSMLDADKTRQVVERVQRDLLTPLGPRTLSPADPGYRGRDEGGLWDHESAYQMGIVWPWLMGHFLTAYVRVNGRAREAQSRAGEWLEGMRAHLNAAGLGHISEIADGDEPHEPRGCIAQARSVAEVLRAAVEDVYQAEPRSEKQAPVLHSPGIRR